MYKTFEEALDMFLEDLTVDEDGAPCLDAHGSYSIIREHDGGFYLSSAAEDYRDEVVVSASDIPDIWRVDYAFDPSNPEDVKAVRTYVLEWGTPSLTDSCF